MKAQGRRKRGRPKRRWLNRVRDDITVKGLSGEEVYDSVTCHRTLYIKPHKSWNKMKRKKKIRFVRGNLREDRAARPWEESA